MGKWKALVFSNTQKHLQLRRYLCKQQINGNGGGNHLCFQSEFTFMVDFIVRWNPPPSPTPPRYKHILGESWTPTLVLIKSSCLKLAYCTETRVHLLNGSPLGHAYMDWFRPDVCPPIPYIQLHHRNFYSVISRNFCEIGTFMYLLLLKHSKWKTNP